MFLPRRFYIIAIAIVTVIAAGYWWSWLFPTGIVLLALFGAAIAVDCFLLWRKRGVRATRDCSTRFSCGDQNPVEITVNNDYPYPIHVDVIDEIPFIFQRRDINFTSQIKAHGQTAIQYSLRPTERGVYGFGRIRVFASTPLGLIQRRYTCAEPVDVKVYPSYLMLNRYELLAMSNNLTEFGIKRIRRVGNNTEFEQVKDYVQGDDYRTINWTATARRNQLMVNVYRDERSQQIISIIDKGRLMQQAFDGMTLLDYAINATLVLSHIAIKKDDKAGIITFNDRFNDFLAPAKTPGHMRNILETLYAQQTSFGESDLSALLANVIKLVRKRSLLILYTNFSGLNSLNRQLPYLQQLNQRHRLLVVFFSDTQLQEFINSRAVNTEDYYRHVIAEKIEREKLLIVNILRQAGILALLTSPDQLSVDVVNRYLEIKSRQMF